jgi:hypothetical protein
MINITDFIYKNDNEYMDNLHDKLCDMVYNYSEETKGIFNNFAMTWTSEGYLYIYEVDYNNYLEIGGCLICKPK